jgi:hypothetical protein
MGDVTVQSKIENIMMESKTTKDGVHQFMTVILIVDEPTEGQVGGVAAVEKKGLEACVAIDSTVVNADLGKITIGSKKAAQDGPPVQIMKLRIVIRGPDDETIKAIANKQAGGVVAATLIATRQLEIAGTEAPRRRPAAKT